MEIYTAYTEKITVSGDSEEAVQRDVRGRLETMAGKLGVGVDLLKVQSELIEGTYRLPEEAEYQGGARSFTVESTTGWEYLHGEATKAASPNPLDSYVGSFTRQTVIALTAEQKGALRESEDRPTAGETYELTQTERMLRKFL